MKKLFTMLIVSAFCTMAYAATATTISVKSVTIPKGGTAQLEVTVNNATSNTAFQFDLTLPAGVSVESVTMNNGAIVGKKVTEAEDTNARKLKYGVRDANANKYRFLSYDNNNAKLTDGKVVITLAATAEAETGSIAGSEILVVNDEGGKTEQVNGDVASITVADVKVSITSAGQAIFCSNKDLDFTNCGAKAYIVTGYDKESGTIWLTRVNDVPANTAVLLMGAKGDYYPVVAESKTIYENMLVGSVEGTTVNKDAGNGMTNYILSKPDNKELGFYFAKENGSTIKAGGGYLPLPTTIEAAGTDGSNVEISMNKYGMKSYCSDQSLDFSGETNLKAYAATGYDKTGTVLLSRLKEVPAKTGIVLLAPKEAKTYTIPTKSMQQCYANMLKGTLTQTTINKLEGDMVNYYVSVKNNEPGFYWASESGTPINPNSSWLPVPKSMTSLAATARNMGVSENLAVTLNEDVISMKVFSIGIDGEGETTGISRVAAEAAGNDAWYNLSGQRISAPTKKGLYIKNGKKIVVK